MVLLRIRERLGDSHSAGPETELAGLTVSGLTGKTNFNLVLSSDQLICGLCPSSQGFSRIRFVRYRKNKELCVLRVVSIDNEMNGLSLMCNGTQLLSV